MEKDGINDRKFARFCQDWLCYKKPLIKISSYCKYEQIIRLHLIPLFGERDFEEISEQEINYFSRMLSDSVQLSDKSVRDILGVLSSVLRYSYKITRSPYPVPDIHYPKLAQKEIRVLSLAEQHILIDYLTTDMDECKFGVFLAMVTGMRIGEICALRWADISIDEGIIRVSSSLQRVVNYSRNNRGKTELVLGKPKSACSQRSIPLTRRGLELCAKMYNECNEYFVLTGTAHYMEPRTLQNKLKKYTKACGLEGVHFHTLRHTFATRCIETGFEIKSLSEVLGHADVNITMRRYMHCSMEFKKKNMERLNSLGL